MIKVYGYYPSGNSYKVELLLTRLEVAYEFIHLDLLKGESRNEDFLAMNPNGRVPLVELDGRYLAESHAILSYFAEGTDLVPDDPWERAKMWQWMCFEQYQVEPNIGTARYHITLCKRSPESIGLLLQEKKKEAQKALRTIDDHLADRPFMVSNRFTLADLSLFAYVHVTPEAGIPLTGHDNLLAWLERIRNEPRFIPMTTLDYLETQE